MITFHTSVSSAQNPLASQLAGLSSGALNDMIDKSISSRVNIVSVELWLCPLPAGKHCVGP